MVSGLRKKPLMVSLKKKSKVSNISNPLQIVSMEKNMKKLNPYFTMIAIVAAILIQPFSLMASANLSPTVAPPQTAPQSPVFGDIVAHCPLTSDLNDATGRNAPFVTKGVSFNNGAILSNGVYGQDEWLRPGRKSDSVVERGEPPARTYIFKSNGNALILIPSV